MIGRRVVQLGRLRAHLDDRPGLHAECISTADAMRRLVDSRTAQRDAAREDARAETRRRIDAEQRAADLAVDLATTGRTLADAERALLELRAASATEVAAAWQAADARAAALADAESQGRANFDAARRTVERRTQQRDDARALTVGLLRVLDAAADALDAALQTIVDGQEGDG